MRVRVLRYLSRSPRMEHALRDIARALSVGPSSARVALLALADQGLLESRRLGNSDGYRLRSGKVRRLVESVFRAEDELERQMEETMRRIAPPGVTVLLFGSAARAAQTPRSDLDLLVVAADGAQAALAAERLRDALDDVGPLRPRFVSLDARGAKRKRREPWLQNARTEGRLLSGPPLDQWF